MVGFLATLLALPLLALAVTTAHAASAPALRVGDTLACESSDPARKITVVIGRIDVVEDAQIVSLSLHAIAPDGQPVNMAHLPIAMDQVLKSCPRAAEVSGLVDPGFEDGYATWRRAFDSHQGGFFTLSVDQVVEIVIQQLARLPHAKPPGTPT